MERSIPYGKRLFGGKNRGRTKKGLSGVRSLHPSRTSGGEKAVARYKVSHQVNLGSH